MLVFAWVAAAVVSVAAAPAASAGAQPPTRNERSFLRAVNDARMTRSLPPVLLVLPLENAARFHSSDMVTRQYFAHGRFPARLWEFGARDPIVGEDLGWSVDDGSATKRIVTMWLASPTHRAILLRRGFRYVGIGVSRGPFQGWLHAVVVTADFEGN